MDGNRRRLLIEISVVLSLTVFRPVLMTIGAKIWQWSVWERPFGYYFFGEILRGLSIIILVWFILWLKEDQWKEVGLVKPDWIGDVFLGWALLLLLLLWIPIEVLLAQFGLPSLPERHRSFLKPSGVIEYPWIVLSAIVTAFAEELLVRGYLISRLMRLFSRWKSILLSAVIFSIWHFSYEVQGLLHMFLWGLIFGIAFTKTCTLWPLVIAHALNNTIADFFATT